MRRFPLEHFLISGFAKPFRWERSSRRVGIMLFIRDDIPFRMIKPGNVPSNTEAVLINLRKRKWLMCCNPNKSLINKFTDDTGKALDSFVALDKKWSFPLSISSENVTKSAGNCWFVTFTEEILNGKLHFLCSVENCDEFLLLEIWTLKLLKAECMISAMLQFAQFMS